MKRTPSQRLIARLKRLRRLSAEDQWAWDTITKIIGKVEKYLPEIEAMAREEMRLPMRVWDKLESDRKP